MALEDLGAGKHDVRAMSYYLAPEFPPWVVYRRGHEPEGASAGIRRQADRRARSAFRWPYDWRWSEAENPRCACVPLRFENARRAHRRSGDRLRSSPERADKAGA